MKPTASIKLYGSHVLTHSLVTSDFLRKSEVSSERHKSLERLSFIEDEAGPKHNQGDQFLSVVQKQLKRLKDGGIIVSQPKGRTRLFLWNPRYPFRKELQSLLEKSFEFMPETEIKKYYRKRQRPRRIGNS